MYVVCGGQTFIKLISIKFGDNNFSPKIYLNFISHHYQGIFFKISIDNRLILKNQLNVQTCRIIQIYASNKVGKILEMMKANLPILPSIKIIRKNIAPKVKSDINKVVTEFEKLDKRKVLENIKEFNKLHLIYDEISSSSIDIDENDLEISFSINDNYVYTEKENLNESPAFSSYFQYFLFAAYKV